MTIKNKYIDLATGITLQYVEQGDHSGLPILFIPGALGTWKSYERIFPYLPSAMHAFSITLRGRGDSDKPESGYDFKETAIDIAAFMDAHHLDSAVLVGHSHSTLCIQRFGIDFPERTRGLVMIGGVYSVAHTPEEEDFWENVIMKLEDPIETDMVVEFYESIIHQPVPGDYIKLMAKDTAKAPARVWREVYRPLVESDNSDDLHKITATTLLVRGEQDKAVARDQQDELLKAIPGAQLKIYEAVGHCPNWEIPERFASDLIDFVEALPDR